jgi:hypothetical protein
MTTLAQAAHVMAKDLRDHWRLASLYLTTVLVATLHAIDAGPFTSSALAPTTVLLIALGVLLSAIVILDDSPTRTDAFYASNPLSATAMVFAKLGDVLLLVAIAAVGQWVAIRSYDLSGTDALGSVGTSAFLYSAWLLATLCVAALVRDLRTFLLAVTGMVVAYFAMTVLIGIGAVPLTVGHTLEAAGAIAEVAFIAWLYRSRDTRRRTRVAGFALAAVTVLMIETVPGDADSATLPATIARPAMSVLPSVTDDGGSVRVAIRSGSQAGDLHFTLHAPVITITLLDGSTLHLPATRGPVDVELDPLASTTPALRGVTSGPSMAPPGEREVSIQAEITTLQRERIRAGMRAVSVDGRVTVTRAESVGTLALRDGTTLTHGGRRIRIESWDRGQGVPVLTLSASRVQGGKAQPTTGIGPLGSGTTFALLNMLRHELSALSLSSGSHSFDGMVLPGAHLETRSWQLGGRAIEFASHPDAAEAPGAPARQAPSLDSAWLHDARLLVIAHRPIGGYPLHLVADLPQRSASRP